MKIGLALGGGGAKGFAHIGFLRGLLESGVQPDIVTGTSIGALVGAVFAAGKLDELVRETEAIRLTDLPILLSPAWSLRGLFSGKNVLDRLRAIIGTDSIEKLPIPFAATSCDLTHCKLVVFRSGDVQHAVRASIAIPAVFTPVEHDGALLVDGGVMEPVPVATAYEMGADFVIAVDLFGNDEPSPEQRRNLEERMNESSIGGLEGPSAPMLSAVNYLRELAARFPERAGEMLRFKQPHIIDIMVRTFAISQRHLTALRLRERPPNVHVCPAVADVGVLDFHRGMSIMERGREAAVQAMPEIQRLLAEHHTREQPKA